MKTRCFAGLVALALGIGASGCGEPPPDTTPGVRIISPVTNQQLPAGKAIEVVFQISGIDPDDMTGKPFRLDPVGTGRQPGRGRVVAYFNGTSIQAVSAKEGEPLTVPSPPYGSSPAAIITPGAGRLSLFLQYSDGTPVSPQRAGEVTVNIVP